MQRPTILLRSSLGLIAALGIAACTAGPDRIEETDPTVTYRYDGTEAELQEVTNDARQYCADRYNKEAELERRTEDRDGHLVVTFQCV